MHEYILLFSNLAGLTENSFSVLVNEAVNLNTCMGFNMIVVNDSSYSTAGKGFPNGIAGEHCFGLSCVKYIVDGKFGFQLLISRSNIVKHRWIYGNAGDWF